MNIQDFAAMKKAQEKIVMLTAYDFFSATIIESTAVDCVLVGDSAAMVMHGHADTTRATVEMMASHVKAVARGLQQKFLIADLPFLSYRKSLEQTMDAVHQLISAGAHAVKLEGATGNLETIHHLVTSGVPVMGHIGLTPQFIHQFGGFKVQGKNDRAAQALLQEARDLEKAGCFSIVLECIPADLAKKISEALSIPTIGIGAGPYTDGQVLVWHDMLGIQNDFTPKFLKRYAELNRLMQEAINTYSSEVKQTLFPLLGEHTY